MHFDQSIIEYVNVFCDHVSSGKLGENNIMIVDIIIGMDCSISSIHANVEELFIIPTIPSPNN